MVRRPLKQSVGTKCQELMARLYTRFRSAVRPERYNELPVCGFLCHQDDNCRCYLAISAVTATLRTIAFFAVVDLSKLKKPARLHFRARAQLCGAQFALARHAKKSRRVSRFWNATLRTRQTEQLAIRGEIH